MHGEALIIKRRSYLTAHNTGKWRRRWVEVIITGRRVQLLLDPGQRSLVGPFEAGENVSVSSVDQVAFQFVDAPDEHPQETPNEAASKRYEPRVRMVGRWPSRRTSWQVWDTERLEWAPNAWCGGSLEAATGVCDGMNGRP
jgi:hypothetical protein